MRAKHRLNTVGRKCLEVRLHESLLLVTLGCVKKANI